MGTKHETKVIGDYTVDLDEETGLWTVYDADMVPVEDSAYDAYADAESDALAYAAGELAEELANEIAQCGDYGKLKAIQAILGI